MIWKTYVGIGLVGIVLARWPVGSCEPNPAPTRFFLLPKKKKVMDFVGIWYMYNLYNYIYSIHEWDILGGSPQES